MYTHKLHPQNDSPSKLESNHICNNDFKFCFWESSCKYRPTGQESFRAFWEKFLKPTLSLSVYYVLVIILLFIVASIVFNFYINLLIGRCYFPSLTQRILFGQGLTKASKVLIVLSHLLIN